MSRTPRGRLLATLMAGLLAATVTAAVAGCADFSTATPTYTIQPTLSAPAPTPQVPGLADGTSPATGPTPTTGQSEVAPDPCRPSDPAVVAACLSAPWGLAVLPDGSAALVGERTTGRILLVAPGQPPQVVTTVAGIDAAGDGGLLGIALSPAYDEDNLLYAYITTATDNRIVRIAPGQAPKTIFAGIPKGRTGNGGRIVFGADGDLYVATGSAGHDPTAIAPGSLAGKVLRLTESGKPAPGNPHSGSPVYASGFTDVRGLCTLPGNRVGALDHRRSTDLLIPLTAGKDYTTIGAGQALWTWGPDTGGAVDCAVSGDTLATTSLDRPALTGLTFAGSGAFSGSPNTLLDNRYGRLLTATAGGSGQSAAFWLTTSNKDGHGKPTPSDDRVIVIAAGGGGGSGGLD